MTDDPRMRVRATVIVLAWNAEKFLGVCLDALLAQDVDPFEIIVVDNGSSDNSVALVENYAPRVRLIRNEDNLGYAGGNNVGIRVAQGEIVVLLNPDTQVHPGWLRALIATFDDPAVGIVGCKSLYPDGHGLQHAGGVIEPGTAFARHVGWGEQDLGQYDTVTEPDYVTGAALGIRRQVIERLGGLDDNFYPMLYEEVDYCYRARRAGFRVVYQPRAVLHHYESTILPASYSRALVYQRNRIRFVLRHWDARALAEFFAAERAAIETAGLLDDLVACARAYWINLLAFPRIALERQKDSTLGGAFTRGTGRLVIKSFQELRQSAHRRLAALIMRHAALAQQNVAAPEYAPVAHGALAETIDLAGLYTHIQDLEPLASLELPFPKSAVPLVGPLIEAGQFWMLRVLRHYLQPVLHQQSVYNLRTFRAQATLMRAMDALSRIHQLQNEDEASVTETLLAMLEENKL